MVIFSKNWIADNGDITRWREMLRICVDAGTISTGGVSFRPFRWKFTRGNATLRSSSEYTVTHAFAPAQYRFYPNLLLPYLEKDTNKKRTYSFVNKLYTMFMARVWLIQGTV